MHKILIVSGKWEEMSEWHRPPTSQIGQQIAKEYASNPNWMGPKGSKVALRHLEIPQKAEEYASNTLYRL